MSQGNPRLVVAGTSGDSGKTLVSLGLLACFRRRELSPAPFKKGPDYIDAAWLSWAAGRPCRNLDTFLQSPEAILGVVARFGSAGISVVEGNRGLHDGMDVSGTHSTASLAKLLRAPVLLVVNTTKVTRTVAAAVLGCRMLDPDVRLAGVVLNQVAGPRHRRIVTEAVQQLAGVEVVGAIPRQKCNPLPDRHLGLVTPEEHPRTAGAGETVRQLVQQHVDLERVLELAREHSGALPHSALSAPNSPLRAPGCSCRIGLFRDSAFTFYYPENLEALQAAGAELVQISGLEDRELPEVDGLYLGGGFPETHASRLADNRSLMQQVRRAADAGMPIYAECGGMIYLSRSLTCGDQRYPMAGVLPVDLELFARPQGHGYVEFTVDGENPFFARGTTIRGHEFHYTGVVGGHEELQTAFALSRGSGCFSGRDGIIYKNVLAGYAHLHALGTARWAPAFVTCAKRHAGARHLSQTQKQ